ncbi:MAG: aconitase family protein [Nocardioidaceae bacterium]
MPSGEPDLLYIDLHLVHEVTSPQAFDGLRLAGRPVRRPGPHARHRGPQHPHHRTSTSRSPTRSRGPRSRRCARNCAEFGVRLHPLGDVDQGIVHVIGPAARAHPAGHDGRVRRLAHLDPRRLRRAGLRDRHQRGRARARHPDRCRRPRPQTMAVTVDGDAAAGVTRQGPGAGRRSPQVGTGGGQGYVVEYRGEAIERAVDGGADDDLQHVDRVRAPRPA